MLYEFVKNVLVPGSVSFLLLAFALGVAGLYFGRRGARLGRLWLTSVTLLYVLLAVPWIADRLTDGLVPNDPVIRTAADAQGARVVVVLGNGVVTYEAGGLMLHPMARGTTLGVLEGARLYRVVRPDWVIASGGIPNPDAQKRPESEVMRDHLVTLGVPSERILLDSTSHNTSEQLVNVARMLTERKIDAPVILVTMPAHCGRAKWLAESRGLKAIAAPVEAIRDEEEEPLWDLLRPSVGSLRASEIAIYEYLAIVKDWLRPKT